MPFHCADATLPTPSQAEKIHGTRIYPPELIAKAYGMGQAHATGWDGSKARVAVLSPGHNPYLEQDLAALSTHLATPSPRVEVLSCEGPLPAAPTHPEQPDAEAAAHASAVAQAIHLMAPAAQLLIVEVPYVLAAAEALSTLSAGLGWLAQHRRVEVVVWPFGYAEPRHAARPLGQRLPMETALQAVLAQGASLVAASGNDGPTEFADDQGHLYQARVVGWPASHPDITTVGGARLHLDDAGRRLAPDTVWGAEPSGEGADKASGGGHSILYARPAYQDPFAERVGPARGIPDLLLNASGSSRMWLRDALSSPGWTAWAGTSIAAALLGGILACAAGAQGSALGPINPRLYAHANKVSALGLAEVSGETTANGVGGFAAHPGYDLASGLGALHHAPTLISALLSTR